MSRRVWLTEGIQAIFQDPFKTFNPLRTVDSYFFETVDNYGIAKTRDAAVKLVDEKLAAVGLSYEEFAGRYPSEFSGGQLQRISIARALLTDPDLLIADEPVSMVDASLRMSIVNLFKELKEKLGVSVLYITHDLATAYYISDFVAVMYRGCIVELGAARDVLTNPMHPYTRLLLESIPSVKIKWNRKQYVNSDMETKEFQFEGCKFRNRCAQAKDVCIHQRPQVVLKEGGRQVYCHFA